MEKAIQLDNVSKHFGKKTVLTDINITIDKGQIYGLIGPSGAGSWEDNIGKNDCRHGSNLQEVGYMAGRCVI